MITNSLSYLRLALWIGTAAAILGVLVSGVGPLPALGQQAAEVAGPSGEPAPVGDESAVAPTPAPTTADKSINIWQLTLSWRHLHDPDLRHVAPRGDDCDRAIHCPPPEPRAARAAGRGPRPTRRHAGQIRSAAGLQALPGASLGSGQRHPRDAAQGRPAAGGDRKHGRPGQPARSRQALCQCPLAQYLGFAVDDARADRHDPGHDHGLPPAHDSGRRAGSHAGPGRRHLYGPRDDVRRACAWPFPRRFSRTISRAASRGLSARSTS